MTTVTERTKPEVLPAPSAGTVLDLLDRSRAGLVHACRSQSAPQRYTEAHLAALRAAAALVAARTVSTGRSRPGWCGSGWRTARRGLAGSPTRISKTRPWRWADWRRRLPPGRHLPG